MNTEMLEKQLSRWKQLLLIYAGVGGTLLVEALVDLPNQLSSEQHYMNIGGFAAAWLVLELACLVPGISLLALPAWRRLTLKTRLETAFGYLGVGWAALLAMGLHAASLVPDAYNYMVIITGMGLVIAYALSRRGKPAADEIFP